MTAERLALVKTSVIESRSALQFVSQPQAICQKMESLYTRAQRAMAELKGAVHELIASAPSGLTNAEIGRSLGIYQGHVGHEGHVSRTILGLLEVEGTVIQDKTTKRWSIRKSLPVEDAVTN